jgi:NAD(P)H-hydrate epimerase
MFINLPYLRLLVEYITPKEMEHQERQAVSRGIEIEQLMENAGRRVAEEIQRRYPPRGLVHVLVVAGSGNNGGDGIVAARYLANSYLVEIILLSKPEEIKTSESRKNWGRLSEKVTRYSVTDSSQLENLETHFAQADIIVDAILGTGIKGEIREPVAGAIRRINQARAKVVAIDVPSGLDPLTGVPSSPTVAAEVTVALHRAKVGLKGQDALAGEIVVAPIGID